MLFPKKVLLSYNIKLYLDINSPFYKLTLNNVNPRFLSYTTNKTHNHRQHMSCDYSSHHSSLLYKQHTVDMVLYHQLLRKQTFSIQDQSKNNNFQQIIIALPKYLNMYGLLTDSFSLLILVYKALFFPFQGKGHILH